MARCGVTCKIATDQTSDHELMFTEPGMMPRLVITDAATCPICALAELLAAADAYDREEPDAEVRYLAAKGRARVLTARKEG